MSEDRTEGQTPKDPTPVAAGPRTAALLQRVDGLAAALARGGSRVPEPTATSIALALDGVRERLALGVDHTVVALVGGTGSGKSSVFNALAGLEFADVGVRRPTTSEVTACVWAHDASALLDWLGVARDRRIERESALDGESQADLRGLVLLDLPDHDSVEPLHRAVVDRLLPLVDLLVFVVDPQKYADDALHSGYLRHLAGHEDAMLVVLNQVDTVPVEARAGLLADVSRLLTEDGLTGVGVHGVSARSGDGILEVRAVLATAVAGRSVAELRAGAELDDAARALAGTVAEHEPESGELPRAEAVDGLAEAAGLAGVVAAVVQAPVGSKPGGLGGAAVSGPSGSAGAQADRVGLVRSSWTAQVARQLPAAWQSSLADAVATVQELTARVDERLAAVPVPPGRRAGELLLRVLGAVLGLGALAALGLAIGSVLAEGGWSDTALVFVLATAGGVVVAGLLLLAARAAGRRAARRRAAAFERAAREALGEVVQELLAAPTEAVLGDHRAVRTAAERLSTSPPTDGGSTGRTVLPAPDHPGR